MGMDIPSSLRAYRVAAGLTQADLALRVGVSQSAISDWETGETTPSVRSIVLLAGALGISTDELLGVQGTPRPDAGPLGPGSIQ